MSLRPTYRAEESGDDMSDSPTPVISDEHLLVRNYDGTTAHDISVRFVDVEGDSLAQTECSLAPLTTQTVNVSLPRGVYRVEARLDSGDQDSAECIIGSGPGEFAAVEVGNGIVSVTESHL